MPETSMMTKRVMLAIPWKVPTTFSSDSLAARVAEGGGMSEWKTPTMSMRGEAGVVVALAVQCERFVSA
jgi:hypothetical protein